MANIIIRKAFSIYGLPTDPDAIVLEDRDNTYGVRRTDTDEVIVEPGTEMERLGLGVYQYVFAEPAPGLIYQYCVKVEWQNRTFYYTGIKSGPEGIGTSTLYGLASQVSPWLRNCPDGAIEEALRDTARRFCRDTTVFCEDIEVTPATATETEFPLLPSWEADVLLLLEVRYENGRPTTPIEELHLNNTLKFSRPPRDPFTAVVALLPRPDCVTYPDFMLHHFGDIIAHGTIAHLKSMADQPWSDPKGAEHYWDKWYAGIGDVKTNIAMRRVGNPLRIRPRKIV